MHIAFWILSTLLVVVGLVGSFLPLLPGTTLILAGVLCQKWLLPSTISTAAVVIVAAIWLLSLAADIGCTLAATRLFGGSKWGLAGASGGFLIGMFISVPALIIGSVLGTLAAEKWLARRKGAEALRAATGAMVGFMSSMVARVACAFAMLAVYLLSIYFCLPRRG